MEAAANMLLIVIGLVCGVIWIVSLVNWDGKCPCKIEDCQTCPYGGACEHQDELRKKQEEEQT